MERFNRRIEGLAAEDPDIWGERPDIERLRRRLRRTTNELIKTVDHLSSTTFTCLFVFPLAEGPKGLIFHCGDSCIFKVDVSRKRITQISWSNMNMVGRAKRMSQEDLFDIEEDDRFCSVCGTSAVKTIREEISISADNLIQKVKELIHEGNVTRIIVKNEEGKTLIEIPATVGVIGVLFAPWLAALGAIAALATKCKIVVERRE